MSVETESDAEPERSVDELSRQLGEAIAELPEYERYMEAKDAVESDEAVQEQIQEFEEFRSQFMQKRQTGEATQDDLRELQRRQEELHDIPVMANFLQAQNVLELRLQELNEHISAPLALDFGEQAGGCCQD